MIEPRSCLFLPPVLLAVGLLSSLLHAESVSLKPVADTSLFEQEPANNLGATLDIPAGTTNKGKRNRLLLRFDIAGAIPSGAIINSAALTLTVTASGGVDSTFSLHRVLQPWGEGAKSGNTGAAATALEATWIARFAPSQMWSAPGGTADQDFASTASASLPMGGPGVYSFGSSAGLVADIDFWLRDASHNDGWVLISGAEATAATAKRIASRENGSLAPLLVVDYSPPPPAPRIDAITRVADEVRIHFAGEAGKLYAVEYKQTFSDELWSTLTQVASKFFPTNFVVPDSGPLSPQRFYRVGLMGDVD